MASQLCFFQNPLSWISILGPLLLVLAGFQGYGLISIIVSSIVVILSILIIFTISKQKPSLLEKVVVRPDQQDYASKTGDDLVATTLELPENISISEKEIPQEEGHECGGQIDEYLVQTPPFFLSEREYLGHSSTSEDSEVDWSLQDIMFRSPDCSDGSISDEESLIEIALPSGHYVCHKEVDDTEATKETNYKKRPEFEMGTFFKQHGLVELLAELNDVNEEENLIEIDLSMGSIKSPRRFEIEAEVVKVVI